MNYDFELLKKYRVNDSTMSKNLDGVMISITNKCNLECLHCYNSSSSFDCEQLNESYWLKLLDDSIKKGIRGFEISGGEPLLEKELVYKLLEKISKYEDIIIQINTNGFFLDDEFLEYYNSLKNPKYIQISIDGHTRDICEKVRGDGMSFDYAVQGLKKISNYKCIKSIAVHTINNYNKDFLDDTFKLLKQLKVDRVVAGAALPMGRAVSNSESVLLQYEERIELFRTLKKLSKKYIEELNINVSSFGGIMDVIVYLRDRENWIVVDSDGDVRLSCRMPFIVGNICEDSVEYLFDKIMYFQKSDYILDLLEKQILDKGEVEYSNKVFI